MSKWDDLKADVEQLGASGADAEALADKYFAEERDPTAARHRAANSLADSIAGHYADKR